MLRIHYCWKCVAVGSLSGNSKRKASGKRESRDSHYGRDIHSASFHAIPRHDKMSLHDRLRPDPEGVKDAIMHSTNCLMNYLYTPRALRATSPVSSDANSASL